MHYLLDLTDFSFSKYQILHFCLGMHKSMSVDGERRYSVALARGSPSFEDRSI